MEKALPLETVSFDLAVAESGDISQMSAEEYLSWVRHQADALPLVSRADIDRSKLTKTQTKLIHESVLSLKVCPSNYLPNEKWEREILFIFSELRNYIYRKNDAKVDMTRKVAVPALKDSYSWMIFCLGRDDASKLQQYLPSPSVTNIAIAPNSSSAVDDLLKKRKLEVSLIAGIDIMEDNENTHDKKIVKLDINTGINVNDSEDEDNVDNEEEKEDDSKINLNLTNTLISSAGTQQANSWIGNEKLKPTLQLLLQFDQVLTQRLITHQIDWLVASEDLFISDMQSVWIYSLLANLQKPICRDIAALLRQLYRVCALQRYRLASPSKNNNTSTTNSSKRRLRNSTPMFTTSLLTSAEFPDIEIVENDKTSSQSDNNTDIEFTEKLAALNTLICITGSYFGQSEEYDSRQIFTDEDFKNDHHSDSDDEDDIMQNDQTQYNEENEEELEEGEEVDDENYNKQNDDNNYNNEENDTYEDEDII